MNGPGAIAKIAAKKIGRNDPCLCGSGRKYKHCCQAKDADAGSRAAPAFEASPPADPKARLRALSLLAKEQAGAGQWANAIVTFSQIAELDPMNPQAHHDLGAAWLSSGRQAEAAASFQRAVDLRPGSNAALRRQIDRLQAEGHSPDALRACRRLSRTGDNAFERRHYLAKALMLEGKSEEAEKELRRVLAQAPRLAATQLDLARILLERGMFDEAAQHAAQAVETIPSAFYELTLAKRMTETDRPLVDRIRVLVERAGIVSLERITIHFGLGKAYDDLGDYAEAMRQYEAANQLRAASVRLDRQALVEQYDRSIGSFTAEALATIRAPIAKRPEDDLPVFIVGMPRSGTTLVEQILSSHSAVAAGDELPFWIDRLSNSKDSTIDRIEAGALSEAAEEYRRLLRQIGPNALRVTDKAPFNFEFLGQLRLLFPEARIIHCRRRPIDTGLSIFFMNFASSHRYAWDRGDIVFAYRQYERLMDHWRRALPPDRFTEVQYEMLVADREAETRRLIAFSGLDWDDACLTPERNERRVKTSSLWQARQPVYRTSVERWRRYEPWLGELRELLPATEAGARVAKVGAT
jgi:tetratricopeptide (TPR) repeat protein